MTYSVMDRLSNDILVVLIGRMDIDTFLSFRLSCRRVYNVIHSNIHGITRDVARSTFPGQERIFLVSPPPCKPAPAMDMIRWLKDLRVRQLASLSVGHSFSELVGYDEERKFHYKGWQVYHDLAKINPTVVPLRIPRESAESAFNEESYLELQELEICRRRCHYLRSLWPHHVHGFLCLSYAIQEGGLDGFLAQSSLKGDESRSTDLPKTPNTNLAAAIRFGPELMWKCWSSVSNEAAADHQQREHNLEREWNHGSPAPEQAVLDGISVLMNIALDIDIANCRTTPLSAKEGRYRIGTERQTPTYGNSFNLPPRFVPALPTSWADSWEVVLPKFEQLQRDLRARSRHLNLRELRFATSRT